MNRKLPVTLLYVEDESSIREAVAVFLELNCEKVITAADGIEAMELCREAVPDLVLTDIQMPRMNGLELAAALRREKPELPVIIATAFSETSHLLKAIELGVRAFIRKPLHYEELLDAIRSTALPVVQRREIERLSAERTHSFFPGQSPKLHALSQQVAQVAQGDYSILIHGEKGTGKARAARAIHALSSRSKLPFLSVSCGGVSAERLEQELFGKKRGALGALIAASGGTVLLRGIAEAPLEIQAKLLCFLEERIVHPVGGTGTLPCDTRVLATVTGDPRQAVAEGHLLEGLHYTLADLTLQLPSLREIPAEIPQLARFFMAEGAEDADRPAPRLTDDALVFLTRQQWPGNIRQLKSLMRRAVLHAREVNESVLQPLLKGTSAAPLASPRSAPLSLSLDDVEKWAVTQALAAANGRKLQAAALLGIDYKRLQRKLVRYGLA